MDQYVEITFECVPLRSLGRLDVPLDASAEFGAKIDRVKRAVTKHGQHNAYYLHEARCIFHLTNSPEVGMLEFAFEGTALTDPDDRSTRSCDLYVDLRRETCDWLTKPVVEWFAETVEQAVLIEFNRYVAAGDLQKTIDRMERLQAESDQHGGFLGFGL